MGKNNKHWKVGCGKTLIVSDNMRKQQQQKKRELYIFHKSFKRRCVQALFRCSLQCGKEGLVWRPHLSTCP
jgi:hypothetical protein